MTLVRVGTSPIDRQGLFAATDIPPGTRIIAYLGEKIPKSASARRLANYNTYIFHLNYHYDIDGATLANTARYINHSCNPNCAVEHTTETIWIVALKDIQAGEELSFNYGYDAKDYAKFPCHCGAKNCCGYILGREYWGCIPLASTTLPSGGSTMACPRRTIFSISTSLKRKISTRHGSLPWPAWLCGDAGLWHFGRRERGHMLLPPILSAESACQYAAGILRLRAELGYEVLPENPPGQVYLGPWHLLEFYADVVQRADTEFVLDCAHLAMYQQLMGYPPCTGLTEFPLERIVELHVAGTTPKTHEGFAYWEDDHTPDVLPPTWEIFEWVAPRAPHLKAVVFECERNPLAAVVPGFQRIAAVLASTARARAEVGR